ncbi:MAG: hypothetical protein A2Y73_03910 [Chloroflexi bacterium RBG_13_56_8]|nr:MAG: hypothetical protein A2Y73_03910 [Chloroflexi bacterium RBG_13_56_8]
MDGATAVLPNEPALVAQAAEEPAAFAALYDHYFGRVYNYVRYRVQGAQATDDIVAQVFERALGRITSYQPERAPFSVWLFAIARNAIADHHRRKVRRPTISVESLDQQPSPRPHPEEIAIHNETCTVLFAALAQLRERERDIIALKFAAGLTNRRIAEITNLSPTNVGVILYRAMRRLREELAGQEIDHE